MLDPPPTQLNTEEGRGEGEGEGELRCTCNSIQLEPIWQLLYVHILITDLIHRPW